MYRKISLLTLAVLIAAGLFCQTYSGNPYKKSVRPTRNVIVMIPDGTSIGVVSSARWYQIYKDANAAHLAIDPYLCGTVKTNSSNAPIADSAPATSAFMTGMLSQSGNVSVYPPADPGNDLAEVDSLMSYQPLATILEAMRTEQGKATGLVVTVEFPHATPADCSAHHSERDRYDVIAPQMAYQNLDVMFGGGVKYVSEDMKQHFRDENISCYTNDMKSFRAHRAGKVWSLWSDEAMPYDIDRDTAQVPSLQEMTVKALDLLSQHKKGFFLMVEGSKIDWAAHANDAIGCITEYLAFDKAVQAVIDFAKKDGNTTVVILPDHGNSGFTLGRRDLKHYDKASFDALFSNITQYQRTAQGLKEILVAARPEDFKALIRQYTGIDITDDEQQQLIESAKHHAGNYMKVSYSRNMTAKLAEIMNKRTYFGFTSGGHTGEEVFLAAYHPKGNVPMGMNTNLEINHYLADAAGLKTRLPELTKTIFAKHTDVFKGMTYEIDRTNPVFPVLIVKKGKNVLEIPAFKSVVYLNKKKIELGSVVVYMDKKDMFYLPRKLAGFFQ